MRHNQLDKNFPPQDLSPRPPGVFLGAELVRSATASALDSAHAVYRRQMTVVCATFVEALSRDLARKLFERHPMRMHDYLGGEGPGGPAGMVKLKEIVEHPQAELLIILSTRAAARLTALPLPKLSKQLKLVGGLNFEPALEAKLCRLIEARNRIVHENSEEEISSATISEMFEDLESLADFYSKLAAANEVPVRRDSTEPE